MMTYSSDPQPDRLYNLLPATYREQDAELGEPLRALLRIIQTQADLVEADIEQLWDNFFVETCEPWVIPYLGDLVGTTPLFDSSRIQQLSTASQLFPDLNGPSLIPEIALRNRADVFKTIYYRRRKGTLPMLEELARDVTGWGAHAVEFFERLVWNQFVRNHLRVHSRGTPDVRQIEPLDRLNGAFDIHSHTVDVRPISQAEGWYNIKNIGFFLWRLRSYEAEDVQARPVDATNPDFRYHVSPLGNPAALFNRWRREGDEAGLATELHVPGPIRPAAFYEDLQQYLELPVTERPGFTEFYGLFDSVAGSPLPQAPNSSLMIFRDGEPVPPDQVRCMDLSTWQQPTGEQVGVDVRRGRLSFGTEWVPEQEVRVFYHYGFAADLGGGSYQRLAWQVRSALASRVILVDQSGVTAESVASINAALTEWSNAGKPNTIIAILDSHTYRESLAIEPADDRWLVIEAVNGVRPHLQLEPEADPVLPITGNHPDASVTFSGLLIEGGIEIVGSLGRIRLLHSTLVPGRRLESTDGNPATTDPSLSANAGSADDPLNTQLRVEIAFSIVGRLVLPDHCQGAWLLDSIVDGVGTTALSGAAANDQPGAPLWLERVTVFGAVFTQELHLASEVIFTEPVIAQRRQRGCVRFSFVPEGAETPLRYRCQPDLEIATQVEAAEQQGGLTDAEKAAIAQAVREWLVPRFTSIQYGQPAYSQLHLGCPRQIQTGAEDGSEMGVFCHLKQPQRAANLRLRLQEYLPFGLEAGLIYVT